jgi:hypothetical protein
MFRRMEKIKERCDFLEGLGFEINHEDSNVGIAGIDFDFSATALDNFSVISTAVKRAYVLGADDGKKKNQDELRKLLGIL